MGQYWFVVNLDKEEFIHPHVLGSGLKLLEQVAARPGTASALILLLAAEPEARGGGDFDVEDPLLRQVVGRWAGDRIALIGDYAEADDLPGERADLLYIRLRLGEADVDPEEERQQRIQWLLEEAAGLEAKGFPARARQLRELADLVRTAAPLRDISHLVAAAIERVLGGRFEGSGWRKFVWDDEE